MGKSYIEVLRVLENDNKEPKKESKSLARRQSAFLRERDKIENRGSKSFVKTTIDIQNQILQDLKNLSLNDWERRNLYVILEQLNNRSKIMESRLSDDLSEYQKDIINRSSYEVDMNMQIINVAKKGYFPPYLPEELFSGLQIMSSIPITDFTDSMRKEAANIIRQGVMRQESVSRVIDRITKRFEKSNNMGWNRADSIARTELLRASSTAVQFRGEQIAQEIPTVRKKWVHYESPGQREGHAEAERKYSKDPIEVNKKFRVRPYGSKAKNASQRKANKYEWGKYPRDPEFSAANTVYCGCSVIYVNKDLHEK